MKALQKIGFLVLTSLLLIAGQDRDSLAQTSKEVLEKAKKEGVVDFYFNWTLTHGKALGDRFMKHYPFIKVNHLRLSSEKLANKIMTEARAGRKAVDVILVDSILTQILLNKDLIAPYCSPERAAYAQKFKDNKCLWTHLNLNTHVIGYNTQLVSRQEAPRSNLGLLDPKWKGKMALYGKDYRWFAYTLDKMGEEKGMEFMKRLAGQDLYYGGGHTAILQLVIAGEFPIAVMVYGPKVEFFKSQGAPVDWVADQPVTATGGAISLAKYAPHPAAAKLLIDFVMSKEGQEIVTRLNRVSTRGDVSPKSPGLIEGQEIYPIKLELSNILNKRSEQFRKIFGSR